MSSICRQLPTKGLTLFVDPKNKKSVGNTQQYYNGQPVKVKNLVAKNNQKFSSVATHHEYYIVNGPNATIERVNHLSSQGYLDFGRSVSGLETYVNWTSAGENDANKGGLYAPGVSIQGNAFRYRGFKENATTSTSVKPSLRMSQSGNNPSFVDVTAFSETDPEGDGLDVGFVPKDSTFMAWVWVSDILNNTGYTSYIFGGQHTSTWDLNNPTWDPDNHTETNYNPDRTNQSYRGGLMARDVGNGKFIFGGELYAGTTGEFSGSHSATPYRQYNSGHSYYTDPQQFDYNKWYCVMFVRQAKQGKTTAAESQYLANPTGTSRTVRGNTVYTSSARGNAVTNWPSPNESNSLQSYNARGIDRPGFFWNSTTYVNLQKLYSYRGLARGASFKWIGYPRVASTGYRSFRGKLGPFAVWDRQLSSTELTQAYEAFKDYFEQQGD